MELNKLATQIRDHPTLPADDSNDTLPMRACFDDSKAAKKTTKTQEYAALDFLPKPVRFDDQQDITSVSCGGAHTLAINRDGHVFVWGANSEGQLGMRLAGNSDEVDRPIRLLTLKDGNNGIYGHRK